MQRTPFPPAQSATDTEHNARGGLERQEDPRKPPQHESEGRPGRCQTHSPQQALEYPHWCPSELTALARIEPVIDLVCQT